MGTGQDEIVGVVGAHHISYVLTVADISAAYILSTYLHKVVRWSLPIRKGT